MLKISNTICVEFSSLAWRLLNKLYATQFWNFFFFKQQYGQLFEYLNNDVK